MINRIIQHFSTLEKNYISRINNTIQDNKYKAVKLREDEWYGKEEGNNCNKLDAAKYTAQIINEALTDILFYSNTLDTKIYNHPFVIKAINRAINERNITIKGILLNPQGKSSKFYQILSQNNKTSNIKVMNAVPDKQEQMCFIMSDNERYRRQINKTDRYLAKIGTKADIRQNLIDKFNKCYDDNEC